MDQTANDPVRDQLLASRVAAARRSSPQRQRARLALAGGVAAILLLLALIGAALYTTSYRGRVYRGVSVAGIGLGGLTRDAAVARLDERAAAYTARPVRVVATAGEKREQSWEIAPAEVGVRFDTATAADGALAVGRGGGGWANFRAWFGALLPFGGDDSTLPVALDEARLDEALQDWAPEVTHWPANATFMVGKDGKLAVVPDQAGRGIDADASRAALLDHAARLAREPVRLPQVAVPAEINARMLRDIEAQANAATGQPLLVRLDGRDWTLASETLRAALDYRLEGERLVVALDRARVEPFFQIIADDVVAPGMNARLVPGPDGRYTIAPGEEGFTLDREVTLAAMNAALTEGRSEAVAALKPQLPPIVAADLEPVRARIEAILATPLVVTFEEYAHTFRRADLLPLLVLTEQPGEPEKVAVTLDPARLRALTLVVAGGVNQGVRDAQFRWVDGAVRDIVTSRDGREVQLAATGRTLAEAILGATGGAQPAVFVTKPKVASSDKAKIAITDRLGRGQTDYGFRDANGKHNVELAMEKLDGALVPPGEIFSFNGVVGEQTVEQGYRPGFGIELVGGQGGRTGQIKTVPVIGGGVCQVSTTLFHAAFRAGLAIEERNWHLYWIRYAGPPNGLRGLDATVYYESELDFRFENTTGGWLAIETVADGATARVAIYGKDPGWEVIIDEPEISNERKADPTPVYEKTHDLPPGQRRQLESAVDGFDAAIRRRVVEPGGKVRDVTFRSSYQPSRNVIQVGVPPNERLDTPYTPPSGN